jgi:hypothetical protein
VGRLLVETNGPRGPVGKDSVIASVAWRNEELYRVVLLRRSDGAMSLVEIPRDVRNGMRFFDSDAVKQRAVQFFRLVEWALRSAQFVLPSEFGREAMRDGATPAELGSIRRLARKAVGVDLGEFEVWDWRRAN